MVEKTDLNLHLHWMQLFRALLVVVCKFLEERSYIMSLLCPASPPRSQRLPGVTYRPELWLAAVGTHVFSAIHLTPETQTQEWTWHWGDAVGLYRVFQKDGLSLKSL